jgi:hypothetical protein
MLVRFPSLVDELLDEPHPPASPAGPAGDGAWQRPDVQQLLVKTDILRIARCYGRDFTETSEAAGL